MEKDNSQMIQELERDPDEYMTYTFNVSELFKFGNKEPAPQQINNEPEWVRRQRIIDLFDRIEREGKSLFDAL